MYPESRLRQPPVLPSPADLELVAWEHDLGVGFVDDDSSLVGWQYLGLSVLGGVAALKSIPHDAVLIAVNNNAIRCQLYGQLVRNGVKFATVRHFDTVVAPNVAIGPGTIVCAGAVTGPGAVVGAPATPAGQGLRAQRSADSTSQAECAACGLLDNEGIGQ